MKPNLSIKSMMIATFTVVITIFFSCKKERHADADQTPFLNYAGHDLHIKSIIEKLTILEENEHFIASLDGKGDLIWDKAIHILAFKKNNIDTNEKYLVPFVDSKGMTAEYLEISLDSGKVSSPVVRISSAIKGDLSIIAFNTASAFKIFASKGLIIPSEVISFLKSTELQFKSLNK